MATTATRNRPEPYPEHIGAAGVPVPLDVELPTRLTSAAMLRTGAILTDDECRATAEVVAAIPDSIGRFMAIDAADVAGGTVGRLVLRRDEAVRVGDLATLAAADLGLY